MDRGKLDAWITGHWGYDHPDNQEHWKARERRRIAAAWREEEAYKKWVEGRGSFTDSWNTEGK